jgi:hypothetical protein
MMRTSIVALVAGFAIGSAGAKDYRVSEIQAIGEIRCNFHNEPRMSRAPTSSHPRKWQLVSPSRQKDYTAPSGSSSQLRLRRTTKFRTGQSRRGNTSALPLKPSMI